MPQENQNPPEEETQDTPTEPIPAWQIAVFEANQARIRAETEANELRSRVNQQTNNQPVVIPEGEPFRDPSAYLSRIRDEVAAQVAPLNNFVTEYARKDNYYRLKAQIKATLDQNALAILSRAEPFIDSHFLNNPNLNPDQQTFQTVLTNVIGQMTMNGTLFPPNNQNSQNNRNNQNNSQNNPPMIPPNVRPSGPPSINNSPAAVELTENERRLANESQMSPEEYVTMRDTDPNQAGTAWKKILAARKAKLAGGQ